MIDKKTFSGFLRQSGLKWLAVIVLTAAFICALWVNFGLRAPVEAQSNTVGLLVDYDELKRIADGSYDIEFSDMARKAALSGATGLVVRERILADWEIAGDILVFSGGQLKFQLELQYGESATEIIPGITIANEKTYILTKDQLVFDQLFSLLEAKRRYPERFEFGGYTGIVTGLHSGERATLGLGFPLAQLQEAADYGFQIIPRLRNWEPVTEDNLREVFRWVGMIPNLAGIGFNEQMLPGDGTNPITQDRLADVIAPLGKPLISFEFYDQIGLPSLASRLDNNLLRAHAIAENELQRYTDFQDAMDRYGLAAKERNIRYIYLRFHGLINPAAAMLTSMELIENVREGLIEQGLNVGNPEPIAPYTIPQAILFVLGAGVIAGGGWLIALAVGSFFQRRIWSVLFLVLMILGMIAWAGGLILLPVLARTVFALAAAIFFPCLSVLLVLRQDKGTVHLSPFPAVANAVAKIALMSVMTLIGAMIMSALLAEPAFMLKLSGFRGIKIAHIIPLLLVPFLLWLREEDWYGLLSGTVKSSVKFWQLGASLVLIAGLTVYILRTGNDSPEAVTDLELRFRQMLDNLLGVRPRTTEFLIGHPLMMVLLYYGYRFNMFPILIVGLMGQVSLMNTYAHLHTPLLISLYRSGHGLWIGVLIGIILIVIFELILRRLRTVNKRREERLVA